MKINIEVTTTAFIIVYDGGSSSSVFFVHVTEILKDGTNVVIATQTGTQLLPYADILTYDGSAPTSMESLITAMRALCGIIISTAGGVSSNLMEVGGIAIDTDTGSLSGGTQRMTIADDDPLTVDIEENQHHRVPLAVVQTASDVGTVNDTYVAAGSEIDMEDCNTLTMFCELLVNDSTGIKIQVEAVHTAAGVEYDGIETDQYIYEFSNVDQNKVIVYKTNNGTPLIQLNTKATLVGVTEGTIAINIVKSWE